MEHQPPPFFHRGPSPLVKLLLCALLSLLLMMADTRMNWVKAVRAQISRLTQPLQGVAMAPANVFSRIAAYLVDHRTLQQDVLTLRQQRLADAMTVQRFRALEQENAYLRRLLSAREQPLLSGAVADVWFQARDPFSRKVIIDRGSNDALRQGQAVIDDAGVIGQVTRVYPSMAEVTLLTEKNQAVPVKNLRNGLRGIAFGSGRDANLELRFMPPHADLREGDLLVTSGIDGTYPAGLPVARIHSIERDASQPFARILCKPLGGAENHEQVLVLSQSRQLPEPPVDEPPPEPKGKGKRGRR